MAFTITADGKTHSVDVDDDTPIPWMLHDVLGTEDLKKLDVPTLIVHGDDDQIVPVSESAVLSAKFVRGATLKVLRGRSHGMCTVNKNEVNEDLLAFIKK